MALTPDEQHELQELDELVMDQSLIMTMCRPYLLEDDPDYPLTQWWWRLGKLRAGAYPAHLLPAHLRAIYQPVEQRLVA